MWKSLEVNLKESFFGLLDQFNFYLPNLVTAFSIAVLGFLAALLLRFLTRYLVETVQQKLDRITWLQGYIQQVRAYRTAPAVVASVVFWVTFLFFLVAAIEAIGIASVSDLLDRVVNFIPKVLMAGLILLGGLFAGDLLRSVVSRALSGSRVYSNDLPARAAQILTVIASGIIAIEQLGFDGTVLIAVLAITFGTSLGAVALAFAIGSRDFVSNMLAVQQVSKSYTVGDHVRVAEVSGRIIEITQTAFIIESESGRCMIPARHFATNISIRSPSGV